ncbi:helix-turn-helix transcriptional regulator [Streptomyces sp. NPDC050625]|uniref:helix-turn-helix domain-containing protein n=1 Tax=Streptomyces sp. NPDC050625 TaxID=3154629 RepID=UPI00341DC98F
MSDVGKLAIFLRDCRRKSGFSRADLAEKVGCSISTIQRAESGKTPPSALVLHGYIRVCGLDPNEVDKKWRLARRTLKGTAHRTLTQAPRLSLIRDSHEFGAALVRIWEESDKPSARTMADRTERRYLESRDLAPLSKNTAWRIANRRTLPSSEEALKAYLFACDVPQRSFPNWIQVWRRVRERREQSLPQGEVAAVEAEARLRSRITAAEAKAHMMAVGLTPVERYPGATLPWAAQCNRCRTLSRYRLSSVLEGQGCRVCAQYLHGAAAV